MQAVSFIHNLRTRRAKVKTARENLGKIKLRGAEKFILQPDIKCM